MVRAINQAYKEKYQAEKKRKVLKKIFLFLVLIFGLSGGVIYVLFFSRLFDVREISITNNGFLKNQEVRTLVESYLSEKKLFFPRFSNIFMVSGDHLSSLINRQFPAVERIKVDKNYFHVLEISLDQKEAIGIWCFQQDGRCVYFDRRGTAFNSVGESSGTLLISVSDQKGRFEKLGQAVSSQEMLDLIVKAGDQLKKSKIEIIKFIIPDQKGFRLDAQTIEGWKIYFSAKDDLFRQLSALEVFLAQKVTPEKRGQLQYIDLTVPNRVYYK